MDVKVKDSILVRPATSTPHHELWLSNIDVTINRRHTVTAYIYRRPPGGDSRVVQLLKDALSKVLVHFYPLAGRMIVDATGRLAVDCNGHGALFVEAISEMEIDQLGDFSSPSELTPLVPTATYHKGITTSSLLMIQVTKFKCGGMGVGVGLQHNLVDGMSGLHFVNTWYDVARGCEINLMPHIDRTALGARNPPRPMFTHEEFAPSPCLLQEQQNEQAKQVSFARLTLSKQEINRLKDKARANPQKKPFSTYITLAAHVWKCCCIARGLMEKQTTKLFIPVDGRKRLCRPPLPSGFFGNAIFLATPVGASRDIVSNPISHIAQKIYDEIAKMDDEYLRSQLDSLELQQDLSSFLMYGVNGERINWANLSIASWTSLPIYDADFGWGKPIFMGPAKIPNEGRCYILPSVTDDGSVSVCLALLSHHMVGFKKLFYEL